jgi:hypothetical protein
MPLDSEIVVHAETHAGRVSRTRVRAKRPHLASLLLEGRPIAEAATLFGTLFAICARAQSAAAAAAIAAALGREAAPAERQARSRRIATEIVEEHLWRLLLDWPKLAGEAPQPKALAEARALTAAREGSARPLIEWVSTRVLGEPPQRFLEREAVASFDAWTRAAGTASAALAARLLARHAALGASDVVLLERGSDALARELAAAAEAQGEFESAPHRGGEARETGVLARNAAHPLVAAAVGRWGRGVGARVLARLVDLARALVVLAGDDEPLLGAVSAGPGDGIAWAETARGLLVHLARIEDGRIGGYRIIAPTEWNFHPEGAMARGALGLAAASDAEVEERLGWLVASLDPCAAWRVEIGHA